MSEPAPHREPSGLYMREMMTHPITLGAGMLALIVGSGVFLATSTFVVALVPALIFMGLVLSALIVIPTSPVFRDYIDRIRKTQAREDERNVLMEEIGKRTADPNLETETRYPVNDQYTSYWMRYHSMVEKLDALKRISASRDTAITSRELERLDQATLDYLRLFHSRLMIRERMQSGNTQAVKGQIRQVEEQMRNVTNTADRRKMEQAKVNLEKVLARASGLQAKDATTSASMMAMSDTFEEVCQRIVTNPMTGVSETLTEAEERLSIEEDLLTDMDIDGSASESLKRVQNIAAQRQKT